MNKQKDIKSNTTFPKTGILGAGQLGKMLALAAGTWHLPLDMLDAKNDFPAAPFANRFVEGSFASFEDVYTFGKDLDVLTIEIEHVNTEALFRLQKEGVTIHPDPAALDIIKDKGLQKQFYLDKNIPTAPAQFFDSGAELKTSIEKGETSLPIVQKTRTAGYDGRGVAVIRTESDLDKILPGACISENLVDIKKELAVIVARNENGEIAAFPPVEMEFNPEANLVEYLFCPAQISNQLAEAAIELSKSVAEAFKLCGLLAVELFLDQEGQLLVNEVAPRPHNSGHHTIDSSYTSQYEQHLRAILNWPLGSTKMKTPASVMVNILGEPGYTGPARYDGFEATMQLPGVKLHLYGKKDTKPFRKMGHATILADELETAKKIARQLKETLKVVV